ncbi:DUF262 domain-containing protein [Xanthomonas nasturtii]|uniref:DUF262 domain-containing protein n=1 Tax=Xanthomonas nasturtii TaxID=1843581 RepID=A0A3E1KE21_9XANT|nr:DUF262 domain-containing protein [Xanthomonas nasturtii]MCL1532575.1 DUF262 domain-containing protein [Xanthomonas nasturtii]MCL1567351.1 DUF262 domain-containing protein [Xanthomonas nasturtii]MCL1571245.1 DUF262 domain-containing protein [Xanthomonas nasturtii]MCL1575089.1 DUF262 domain-containing protein [Xanthomonas nasturtii]MCL1582798.1 DUF262 domain-containing protein [Xanthomonas nasturtii]
MDAADFVPEITPQVIHLIDLLKRAKEGRLRVPKFQREYVWRRQDIVDLFDSIARQYPIGTLFLWGAQPIPSSRPNIGPLLLPEYKGETWLVLDGQQRLTTLVGVLLADEAQWDAGFDEDPSRWRLFFDAQANAFTHIRDNDPVPVNYLPVPSLLDTVKLFSQVQKLLSSSASKEEALIWAARAQEVARAIQSYRIPLVEIKTNSLSVAVESFSRLNKKGRSIGQDEMFSALTYRESDSTRFHLAAEIDLVQSKLVRAGFGEVDREVVLRAVLTAANLDLYRTDWTRLGDQVKQEVRTQLPDAVIEASRGLEAAVAFLKEIGVANTRMLPYSMQLVALSAFFGRNKKFTDDQRKFLTKWFWASSFTGWFSSGNAALMRRLVDEMRDDVSGTESPVTLKHMDVSEAALAVPQRFDMRSARVRATLCVLLGHGPKRPSGELISLEEATAFLVERGSESMSKVCYTVQSADLQRSPANRVLDVAPAIRGQAKNWILELDESVRDEVLLSHAIDPSTISLLRAGEHDKFLQKRLDFISSIENKFMKKVGVTLPTSMTPSRTAIDSDPADGRMDD